MKLTPTQLATLQVLESRDCSGVKWISLSIPSSFRRDRSRSILEELRGTPHRPDWRVARRLERAALVEVRYEPGMQGCNDFLELRITVAGSRLLSELGAHI